MEAVRNFKANLKLENKPCGWCRVPLALGEDASVCAACDNQHHQRCWDGSGGCATAGCANAPLRRMDPPPPPAGPAPGSPFPSGPGAGSPFPSGPSAGSPFPSGPSGQPSSPFPSGPPPYGGSMGVAPPGMQYCNQCRAMLPLGAPFCSVCNGAMGGGYMGPQMNAPGSVAALVCGIIGLFICGVIFGIIAITQGNSAKRAIAADPSLGGGGMATAGIVLGIIDLVGWALIIFVQLGAR